MKTIKILLLLSLFVFQANAQDKRFTASIFTDPVATAKDGFNAGGAIEYQLTTMYFKAQVFVFPNLRGTDYSHIQVTPIGFNIHDRWSEWRFYAGAKIGRIKRDTLGFNTYGGEMGIEWYPSGDEGGFYIGLEGSLDWRQDFEFSGAEPKFLNNGAIKIGISF